MVDDEQAHVYVSLERDDHDLPFDAEQVEAVELGGGWFRIVTAPAFVDGLAPGAIVRTEGREGDERPWVVETVRPSDNWLARVMPRGGCDPLGVVEMFQAMGCDARLAPYGVVTVVVSPAVAMAAVMSRLQDGQDRAWSFDLAVPPPWSV